MKQKHLEPSDPPVRGRARPTPFAVVGIGASAGGLEAFSQLLAALPANPGLALVFVQHLAPNHRSALPSLLAAHSSMPVVEVHNGIQLRPNHVYVVPPNVQMELADGHLHLAPRPGDKSQYTPIDHFFHSLARTLRARAIGVVLSGTASDGAEGLRDIKSMGGIALAQAPETAKHDGMPRAAIATGLVDLVLPPHQLSARLVEIARNPFLASQSPPKKREGAALVTAGQLDQVFRLLVPAGLDFSQYKSPTMVRRLLRRMALLRFSDVDGYIRHLEQMPEEVAHLHKDLLIHVTRFFREPESIEALGRDLLPGMIAGLPHGAPLRVWVAGCSTGEEAYSLAMVILESLGESARRTRVQIFGTDVSDAAIEFARQGVYPAGIAADVSPERLQRFFVQSNGSYRVSKTLRELCIFARQDLTRDPPFSRLDLVCCRNVFIYLDGALQKKLLSIFNYALKPEGALLLGHAESIGYNSEYFIVADKKQRIYRKRLGPLAAATSALPREAPLPRDAAAAPPAPERPASPRSVIGEASRLVLDRYAPPSVLLDQNFHVVQFNGDTAAYLGPSPGEPSFHILRLAREGLLHGLRTALHSARKNRKPAHAVGLRLRNGTATQTLDVEVVPMPHHRETFYLVLFHVHPGRTPARGTQETGGKTKGRAGKGTRVAKLEEELAATREYLQATIQEIEAANEELQSANEEILSSNEELQSTNEELDTAKEELESTNEELNTVNDELHTRNEELMGLNADLVNLLGSVQIAIVIVSSDLRIRRFTPMAEKLLNLIPGDVGRPFAQIHSDLDAPDLPALITETIATVAPIEREVQDRQGHWYALRIRPYRIENRIEGAVVALFDIDLVKRSSEDVKTALEFAEAIVETTREPLLVLDSGMRVRTANKAFMETFKLAPAQVEQRLVYDIGTGEWELPELRTLLTEVLPQRRGFEGLRVEREFAGIGRRVFILNARELLQPGKEGDRLVLLSFHDVGEGPRRAETFGT